ncbi:ATP-binding cassette domain-containing protein [Gordonia sp. LSe1-13]|uniref:ATP-binding cassette domain-containing protein n=1 Tax=Gordonia sesuvii TaxID=3116777 RepID=A0ABU7MGL7_9ACTN|nr:ATP-binding cassette domain-containing protein [Gordonia sp. LSe1-13]
MIRGTVTVGDAVHGLGDEPALTVGAAPDNDVVVDHPLVADQHLSIEWRTNSWWVTADDPATPAFAAGVAVTEILVTASTQIRLGDPDDGPTLCITLTDDDPEPRRLHGAPHLMPMRHDDHGTAITLHGILTIGRTPDNDVVVDDMLASRRHARIVAQPDGQLLIEDLASSNGTYVDGHRTARAWLADDSVITIGNSDFVVRGDVLVRGQMPTAASDGLHVHGIGLTVDGGTTLLRDIEFTARPGTLTAVIGPSGAGKSTVSRVVAGLSTPSAGLVTFEGRDVHGEYDALHTRIGMVPQNDVLHRRLTLREALGYAAELRLPPDLSDGDRDRVIAGVLAELHLTEHLDTRVDNLSGGQRKRASMAMELLTGPSLLILDEPTSGLDPALDRQVMGALRRLADAGRVVLVVTHSLTHLAMCDQVLLLAPGGRTAFVGRPDEVPAAMGSADWAEIFAFVAAHPGLAHQQHLDRTHRAPSVPVRRRTGAVVCAPQATAIEQCSTVIRRQLRLIVADPGYLAFLGLLPVVLGLLTLIIPGSSGFGVNETTETAGEALQILVILVVGATFMGTALTIRDLVGERDIFERERAVGLRPGAYLAAKITVFSGVAVAQTAVMMAITFAGKGIPSSGVPGAAPLGLFCAVAALACVSAIVGLAVSATVSSVEQTMPPLVVLVLAQLVFCGGLFRLSAPVLAQLSWLFPSYWGYAGAASAVDLNRISPLAPQTDGAALWEPTGSNVVLAYSALLLIATILVVYTASRLQLDRRR